jgi:hypothetical protein
MPDTAWRFVPKSTKRECFRLFRKSRSAHSSGYGWAAEPMIPDILSLALTKNGSAAEWGENLENNICEIDGIRTKTSGDLYVSC